MEAPWTPASLVPGSNPTARAASGAAARAKASSGWGGSLPSGVGGGGAHCCRRPGTFLLVDDGIRYYSSSVRKKRSGQRPYRGGGGKFARGQIRRGIISEGENFATSRNVEACCYFLVGFGWFLLFPGGHCQNPGQHRIPMHPSHTGGMFARRAPGAHSARARRATFLLTIPTSARDLPSDGEGPPNGP